MDPNPPHTDPPSARVRRYDTGPLSSEEQPVAASEAPQPASTAAAAPTRPARTRPNLLMVLGIALLSVGLIALATWSYLSKQTGTSPASGESDLPKDTIALINSSTPIPLELSSAQKDSTAELTLRPASDGWTSALREARRAEAEGRYSSTISQYSALVGSDTPGESRDALWGLASAYAASGQRELALRAYSVFAGLDDPRAPAAFLRTGQIYEQMSRFSDAAAVYGKYASLGGPAANAVKLMQARLLGSTPEAEKLYNEIIDSKPLDPDLRQALAALADVKSKRGDHAGARKAYERLAAEEEKSPRAVLDNMGRAAQAVAADEAAQAGDKPGAAKYLLAYINKPGSYPYGRYTALDSLLKIDPTAVASGTVAPMLAAQIAFDAGYYGNAIGFMDILRTVSPDSPERQSAALLTGRAFDLLGDPASAYNWYTATVQTYPTSPQAPEAIRRAADALEEQSQWDASLGTYKQAIESYPNAGNETALARINGAVLAYRLEDRDTAATLITPALSAEISPTLKTKALFWAAKLQKSAGNSAWRDTIKQVSTLEPGSYLDFRTRSLLDGEADGGPLIPTYTSTTTITASLTTPNYPAESAERAELLTWAANLTDTVRLPITAMGTLTATTPDTLALIQDSPEVRRAAALLNLGFEDQAHLGFRVVAEQMVNRRDASALAEMVLYLRYHAPPFTYMRVAQALSALDKGDPSRQPDLLLKTLYPTPYTDLVMAEAKQRNIDPLVLYALMKQESQFVPDALSGADARGLTQVIPSTGAGIAQQLGDNDYTLGDLFLPHVSIRYGAYYLASNLPQFDRKMLPVLAAYNGGPGNADRWLQGSALLDPDLFTERIDLFETADYLEIVYRNYGIYKLIYAP
ncbi:MAG: transglycosylase SLT domain-containing protein [Chloroflexota bacterium]